MIQQLDCGCRHRIEFAVAFVSDFHPVGTEGDRRCSGLDQNKIYCCASPSPRILWITTINGYHLKLWNSTTTRVTFSEFEGEWIRLKYRIAGNHPSLIYFKFHQVPLITHTVCVWIRRCTWKLHTSHFVGRISSGDTVSNKHVCRIMRASESNKTFTGYSQPTKYIYT